MFNVLQILYVGVNSLWVNYPTITTVPICVENFVI